VGVQPATIVRGTKDARSGFHPPSVG
jgi:hypothetical protein